MLPGSFSPISNSLRTTVISVSRSGFSIARVDHAVGFQPQRPAQVLVAGVDGFEVIGAVVIRGAVHFGAVVGQFLLDVGAASWSG